MAAFSGERFKVVWASLPEKTKERIREKARYEHMTLAAVIRSWWPRIWKRIDKDDGHGTDQRTRSLLPRVRKPRATRSP